MTVEILLAWAAATLFLADAVRDKRAARPKRDAIGSLVAANGVVSPLAIIALVLDRL